MSAVVSEILERKDRPPYVRFERIAEEDKVASAKAGHYIARDVDMVYVTPPYSKDMFKQTARDWFPRMEQQVQTGRLSAEWLQKWREQYRAWQNGQEVPAHGVPIKGWGVISPGQQETLIHANIRTVEDLAAVNDEGMRRIGMGAMDLRNKAKAWLAQLNDKGPLTQEVTALKSENAVLRANIETLTERVEKLTHLARAASAASAVPPPAADAAVSAISAADILDDPPSRFVVNEEL